MNFQGLYDAREKFILKIYFEKLFAVSNCQIETMVYIF